MMLRMRVVLQRVSRASVRVGGGLHASNGRGLLLLVGGEVIAVSQFTLCADQSRGKRPGFDPAMKPPEAKRLYERFCARLAEIAGRPVQQGVFGAAMEVELVNDGPATFLLDAPPAPRS